MLAKQEGRTRRKRRIRKKVAGDAARPRLSVFRSAKHIYAQAIDDATGTTLATASTLMAPVKGSLDGTKTEAAKAVGTAVAKTLLEKGVESVVFDRNGYIYHGRVKALADAAREAGLKF
jgi:large subunit ribosomal protein L18